VKFGSELTRIVLLSTSQPAANPRLVKEADALCEAGYDVHAYCSFRENWALPLDRQLMEGRRWALEYVGGLPTQRKWIWSRARHALAQRFTRLAGFAIPGIRNRALSRTTPELIHAARHDRADVYIGHNLGALPAVVAGARENGGRAVFDLEDAYSEMHTKGNEESHQALLERRVEDEHIPGCDVLIAASEGIGEVYRQRYQVSPVTILNVLPWERREAPAPRERGGTLRLFWFSQTIGSERGLEDVVAAMARLERGVAELHLLGNWQKGYRRILFALAREQGLDPDTSIYSYPPCQPEEIPKLASSFDVGLAVEAPVSRNREICLTNKLFTYLVAGLAVVATETEEQARFLNSLPPVGLHFPPGEVGILADRLATLSKDPVLHARLSREALKQARERYNWRTERCILLKIIEKMSRVPKAAA
jgi:glycosyltransferase involved in cell wall biosynthesis